MGPWSEIYDGANARLRPHLVPAFAFLFACYLALLGTEARADVCTELAQGNLRDSSYSFSDQEHFAELQHIIETSRFTNYQQWASQGQSLGLNIPLDDVVIGFSGDAKSNSGVFQQELDKFLHSTFEESYSRLRSVSQSETFNAQVLKVLDHCVDAVYRTQPGTYVAAVANSAENFTVTVNITRSDSNPGQTVKVLSIQPQDLVLCKLPNGSTNVTGSTIELGALVIQCTKKPTDQVNGFVVQTTMGPSRAVVLFAKTDDKPTVIKTASWTNNGTGLPERSACSCVSSYLDPAKAFISFKNACTNEVILKGFMDPDSAHPPAVPPFAPAAGRQFAQVTLAQQEEARFSIPQMKNGIMIGVSGCPDPAPVPQNLCFVPRSVFQARGKPWFRSFCGPQHQTPANDTVGKPCSCVLEGAPYPGCFADVGAINNPVDPCTP